MDPATHAVVGGLLAHARGSKISRKHLIFCMAGAVAPDLDFLLFSAQDPVLGHEIHRSFTHSIAFAPIGATLICLFSLLLFRLFKKSTGSLKEMWLMATVGWVSHGVIDTLGSMGTVIGWPFSTQRFAADLLSNVDPAISATLFFLLMAALVKKNATFSRVGLIVFCGWVALSFWNHSRGFEFQRELAQKRGHSIEQSRVLQGFTGSVFLWRSLYEAQGRVFIDGFRIIPGLTPKTWEGGHLLRAPRFHEQQQMSPFERDVARMDRVMSGYLSLAPLALSPSDVQQVVIPHYFSSLTQVCCAVSMRVDQTAKPARTIILRETQGIFQTLGLGSLPWLWKNDNDQESR